MEWVLFGVRSFNKGSRVLVVKMRRRKNKRNTKALILKKCDVITLASELKGNKKNVIALNFFYITKDTKQKTKNAVQTRWK